MTALCHLLQDFHFAKFSVALDFFFPPPSPIAIFFHFDLTLQVSEILLLLLALAIPFLRFPFFASFFWR